MLGSDRKPLACSPEEKGGARRAINAAFENQHVDYKSLHISKKDTSMKYINSIMERIYSYDFGKRTFRKNLWKDTHRRRHDVLPLSGRRQRTGLWQDVDARKKSQCPPLDARNLSRTHSSRQGSPSYLWCAELL